MSAGTRVRLAAYLAITATLAGLVAVGIRNTAGASDTLVHTKLTAMTPASGDNVLYGVPCPDIMVIAARGSLEPPAKSDWTKAEKYISDPAHGAGATLGSKQGLYGQLQAARPDITFSLEPVIYPADNPLLVLDPGKSELYLQDAELGASNIVADIQHTDARCGGTVRYVLGGYSLGAWAVHDALHELGTAQLREIAGVELFGDPKFVPFQNDVVDYRWLDYRYGIAAQLIDQGANSIPNAVASRTSSWCFPTDPVCQAQVTSRAWQTELASCVIPNPIVQSLCAHYWYVGRITSEAAYYLGRRLPQSKTPDPLET